MRDNVFFETSLDAENRALSEQMAQLPRFDVQLPPGTYRVVNGELYRVLPGVPPRLAPSEGHQALPQVSQDAKTS